MKETLKSVYLDHNATSYVYPEIADRMHELAAFPLNPSSMHRLGQYGKKLLSDARQNLAESLDSSPEELIFTSGGTESNLTIMNQSWGQVFVSGVEHESILSARSSYTTVPVTQEGLIDLEALEGLLKKRHHTESPCLLSVQYANNETGIVQDLESITALAHSFGVKVHADCVQAYGKLPLSFEKLKLEYASLSAHKIGGPQGVGLLFVRKKAPFCSWFKGGGQEKNKRAGTHNVAGIVGFGLLPQFISSGRFSDLRQGHQKVEKRLKQWGQEKNCPVTIVGEGVRRLPNTTCFLVGGRQGSTVVMQCDLQNICVSSGSACSSGVAKPSHVLRAMGYDARQSASAVRLSSGWCTTQRDFSEFITCWEGLE